jgi:hypothetical protein
VHEDGSKEISKKERILLVSLWRLAKIVRYVGASWMKDGGEKEERGKPNAISEKPKWQKI